MLNIEHFSSLVLVAGLSGAGKTTASNLLADLGFFTTDNLPVPLLSNFIEFSRESPEKYAKTCLLLDIESSDKLDLLLNLLDSAKSLNDKLKIIFLDCSSDAILKRYSETRRPHPGFNPKLDQTLEDTIQRERNRLQPLKEQSNLILDTSNLNVHALKRELRTAVLSFASDAQTKLRINFMSFGFKNGAPIDCDLIVDVRFLPNPYFVAGLRTKTGLDPEVADYVLQMPNAKKFIKKFNSLLQFLLPQYAFEGKAYMNIGIGCTGGCHRSVAIAEKLATMTDNKDYLVSVKHRDKP